MANEFIARNGLIAQNNSTVTGSLNVTGGVTGSLLGTASYATQALTSSYSTTASYLNTLNQDLTFNGNLTLNGTASVSFLNVTYESASVIYSSGSNQLGDATSDTQTIIGTTTVSGSLDVTGSMLGTKLIVGASNTGLAGNGQVYAQSGFLSNANSSLAGIIGYTNNLGLYSKFGNGAVSIGHNAGTTTVMSIYTSSMLYTGSAFFTGGLEVTGSVSAYSFTGSLFGTSSWASNAVTSSYITTAQTASYVTTAQTASFVATASWANNVVTASYVTGSIYTSTNPALSASYALTASYALSSAGGGGGGAVSQSLYSSSFGITLDGGGGVISTGQKGYYTVNYSGVITGWQLIGDQAGSIVVNIWKTGSGAIPTTSSVITGTEKPTLTSQQINSNTALTSFTTSFNAYDTFGYNVDSATTVSRVNLIIYVRKT